MKRYFALVFKKQRCGYALDYYPEERARYRRAHAKNIIGDFATAEEANDVITDWLRRLAAGAKCGRLK